MVVFFLPEGWWEQKLQPRNAKHVFFRNHVVPFLYRKRGSRKHNVFTFPEGPESRSTQTEPEITRVPCGRRTKNVIHHAVKFVDLITAYHKILNEEVNRAILTGMQWLCRTWPLSGYKVTNAKQNLHKKRREACRSSSSRTLVRK